MSSLKKKDIFSSHANEGKIKEIAEKEDLSPAVLEAIRQMGLSDEEKEAISARIVFTEIDHNYVNPTTDKYPEINNLLDPLDCWNAGKQGYGVSYATFNEYMTWAVFSLYLKDNFDDETFKKRNKADAGVMARGRGFIKFEAFNDFVLEWYENNKEKSLTELYPAAINWFKNQECSSVK